LSIATYIRNYVLFAIAIAIPPVLLISTGNTYYIIPRFWVLFGYVSLLTIATIIAVVMVQRKNAESAAQAFLAATTVKMLAILFFVLVFLLKNHVNKVVFAVDFFYIYFLNMAFEVYGLLRNLRNQNLR